MAEGDSANNRLFLTGMILSMFCWGLSWTSGKILSEYGGALNISFYRFALTFVSLYFILLFLKEKLVIHLRGFFDLFCAAILIALYTYLFFKGLSLGKAGAGGVLVTIMNPIISYGLMLMLTFRMPTRNESLGLLLGILAGALLLKLWVDVESILNAGNSYFLLASFTWALLSLFTAKASRHGSPVSFSFWMYGISTVIMFVLTDKAEMINIFQQGDLKFWGNLFFSSTITTSLATTFYFVATSRLGASKASSFIFMVPISAALGSWLFLKEVPEIHTIIGGLAGVAAVYILNKKIRQKI